MLQQTVARLRPIVPADRVWTVTNAEQAAQARAQLPQGSRKHVLVEPVGRNTAAAIALAAFHIRHAAKDDALMAVLPADHYIARTGEYQKVVSTALNVAREPGRMVVLGIPPTRPETGFGYIERMEATIGANGMPVFSVRRFTEKPALDKLPVALLVQAVAPKPLNVLTVPAMKLSVAELADLGVRRISVGGALARAALTGFHAAAKEIAGQGTFSALARSMAVPAVNGLFDSARRHDRT